MKRDEIVSWLKVEFQPLLLSIPDETIMQQVDNAIRYFNTNSAVRILKMFDVSSNYIEIDAEIKTVTQVLPSRLAASSSLLDPNWVLLGIQSMNYLTADIIAVNEAYKMYSAYFGTDFQWHFERGNDPSTAGKLYCQNIPSGASKLAVIGAKRILVNEDITHEHILDFILRASKALVKTVEGNVLRKADMINVKNDGQALLDEGQEEWKALREELFNNSRWVAFGSRL